MSGTVECRVQLSRRGGACICKMPDTKGTSPVAPLYDLPLRIREIVSVYPQLMVSKIKKDNHSKDDM